MSIHSIGTVLLEEQLPVQEEKVAVGCSGCSEVEAKRRCLRLCFLERRVARTSVFSSSNVKLLGEDGGAGVGGDKLVLNQQSLLLGSFLFEDIFVVDKLDPDGKKFDKVSRIEAHSQNCEMFMHLDVNTEIYPMAVNDKFTMALASTLSLDGTPDTGYYTPGSKKTLADKYEYIMHGKLYKINEDGKGRSVKAEVYVSYGGLLMMLKGDPSYVSRFELDQRLFLLIRKLK